jgi:hypothetical protein
VKLGRDINKYTDLLQDVPDAAHEHIYNQIETAAAIKNNLEIDPRKLRIAYGIRFTKQEIIVWLEQKFCAGDPLDEAFRRRIIDVFINSVYLYDDRITIFYNIKNGRQISYFDVSAMVNESSVIPSIPEEIEGSTSDPQSGGNQSKSEHIYFINGMLVLLLTLQKT